MVCDTPLTDAFNEQTYRLCAKHLAEDEENYGKLPPIQPNGEVVYLVQVETTEQESGESFIETFETGAVYESGLDIVRVEIYEGKKVRVILSDGGDPVVWYYPWHKVLHWQEA